jgi:hypothetical protein
MQQIMPDRISTNDQAKRLTLPVLYGSVRTERQGIRAARFIMALSSWQRFQPLPVSSSANRLR